MWPRKTILAVATSKAVWPREVILFLYSTLIKCHLEYSILLPTKDSNVLKQVMRRVWKTLWAVQHLSYKERLERLGVVQPEEEKTLG